MITFSKLGAHGQLGNQLFQYAMLRAVALKHGYEVAIPRADFKGRKKKDQVELGEFRLRDYRGLHPDDVIVNRYREVSHRYDPLVFEQPDGTDFTGYYQTELYFGKAQARIREEFTFREPIRSYAAEYIAGFYREGFEKVVGVHVRRGDCLNNPHLFHIHTVDYFTRGMGLHGFDGKTCFLFISDDIPWCEASFGGLDRHRFCGTPSYLHDFAVLTECDGHVISGSTFGWWGAWLAAQPGEQLVVCPRPWFGAALNLDTADMTCHGWREILI